MKGIEYTGLTSVDGPIVAVKRSENSSYDEVVYVRDKNGEKKTGRIIDLNEKTAIVQIFGSTTGLDLENTTVEFLEEPMELRVGKGLLGRIFNGLGEPIDGYPQIISDKKVNVNGNPINPYARVYPRDFIQTGISSIDGMNTLIRGQKLPIFSGNGLPHNKLAAQIIRQAKILNSNEEFVMVFAGMGIKYDVAQFFKHTFEESGVLSKVVMFQSLADAPSIERIITPRCALTAAEYLAYECNMHVLVVMTDMTNYCEALREISTTRGEVPGRKMKDGIGEGMTREDHAPVSSQLFAAYSKVKSIRNLASIIGEEELSELDQCYLKFGNELEAKFFTQGEYEDRSIDQTLDLGWKMLSILPREELYRIKNEMIDKYLPKALEN